MTVEVADLAAGQSLVVRYEGGSVAVVDVPKDGTAQRELFEGHLTEGRYTILTEEQVAQLDEAVLANLGIEQKPKRRQPAQRATAPAGDTTED